MDRAKILKETKSFFFRAMREGYAKEGQVKVTPPDFPGCKVITFEEGDFKLEDRYFVTGYSNKSYGTTTIWYKGQIVWMMQYLGEYKEDAIPFLKEVLIAAYTIDQFVGGRGPMDYRRGTLSYVNTGAGGFERFEGKEEIWDMAQHGKSLGWHEYHGMALI